MFLLTFFVTDLILYMLLQKTEVGFSSPNRKADDRHWRFFICSSVIMMATFFWVAVCGRAYALPVPFYRSTNPHTCRPPVQAI